MSALKKGAAVVPLAIFAAVAVSVIFLSDGPPPPQQEARVSAPSAESLAPDWPRIAEWPVLDVEPLSMPDPNLLTTVILLDDSGSMSAEMADAKAAVLSAAEQLPKGGKLAVLALNAGNVLEPTPVADAQALLPDALRNVIADGNTPLGARMLDAYRVLSEEAALQRGFGTYRLVITTDGQASDAGALREAMVQILSGSPIEVATIGLGIGEGHPLNMPGQTRYVSVDTVAEFATALSAATAEQTSFDPITSFSE
ncbi:MAG: VWA domain-containing protein [Pseudomonadota bacterium]